MGLVTDEPPVRVAERVFFTIQLVLLAIVAISFLLPALSGGADWTLSVGGIVAIVCLFESLVVTIFLGLTRDKSFLSNGLRQSILVFKYLAHSRRPTDFLFLLSIVIAIASLVWFFASGTFSLVLTETAGQHFVAASGHANLRINLAEFRNLAYAKDIGIPGAISVILSSATLLALRSVRPSRDSKTGLSG